MIAKREEQIAEARKQIEELQNVSEVLRSRQAKLKQTDCFPSADFDYDRLGAVIYGDYYAG